MFFQNRDSDNLIGYQVKLVQEEHKKCTTSDDLCLKNSCVKDPHSTRFTLEVLANLQRMSIIS